MRQHRAIRPGSRLERIHLEHSFEDLLGFLISFTVNELIGLKQQAVGMPWVDLESFGKRLGATSTVIGGEGTRQQVVKPRIKARTLRCLAERFGRERIVLFFQGQLGRRVISIEEVGLLLDHDVVKLVQHFTRIGPSKQKEPPDGHKSFRGGKPPRATLNEAIDRPELASGIAVVTVQAIDVAAQQM